MRPVPNGASARGLRTKIRVSLTWHMTSPPISCPRPLQTARRATSNKDDGMLMAGQLETVEQTVGNEKR